jgi:hypothetical protein
LLFREKIPEEEGQSTPNFANLLPLRALNRRFKPIVEGYIPQETFKKAKILDFSVSVSLIL